MHVIIFKKIVLIILQVIVKKGDINNYDNYNKKYKDISQVTKLRESIPY